MTGTDISYAISLLNSGKTVAIPTETVYGLAGNAFDPEAVIKIFEIKQRPRFNPLIVHVADWEMADRITLRVPPVLKQLAEHFWPGPLTILAPKSPIIHDIVTAGSPLVAVRMPNHPLTLNLLKQLPFPLAAPSANTFGTISPTTAQHVENQLGSKLDYILDGGECSIGVESTIIKTNDTGKVVILRPGGITSEMMAAVIGYQPEVVTGDHQPEAPGMLKSHYAPSIPLKLGNIDSLLQTFQHERIAVMSFSKIYTHPSIITCRVLSADGNLHEAARNLFAVMRSLEQTEATIIVGEYLPENGIGLAINDRLTRASA
jgi:L-threonylcarbamoyladenylate synthase